MVGKYVIVSYERLQKEYDVVKAKLDEGFLSEVERGWYEGQLDILDDLLRDRI